MPRHNELKNRPNLEPETLEKSADFLEYNLLTHYADPVAYDWESFMYQIGDLIGGNSAGSVLIQQLSKSSLLFQV